ncbi:MAG: hypothetical protein U1F10_05125 [Burkholderiales bacterium]
MAHSTSTSSDGSRRRDYERRAVAGGARLIFGAATADEIIADGEANGAFALDRPPSAPAPTRRTLADLRRTPSIRLPRRRLHRDRRTTAADRSPAVEAWLT